MAAVLYAQATEQAAMCHVVRQSCCSSVLLVGRITVQHARLTIARRYVRTEWQQHISVVRVCVRSRPASPVLLSWCAPNLALLWELLAVVILLKARGASQASSRGEEGGAIRWRMDELWSRQSDICT